MSPKRCPGEEQLVRFVDADLAPEAHERIQEHLVACANCRAEVRTLQELQGDLSALPGGASANPLDLDAHVSEVMQKITALPVQSKASPPAGPRLAAWGAALAAAAALVLVFTRMSPPDSAGEFTARGGESQSSLSRDVGVQLYAQKAQLVPLQPGSTLTRRTPLLVGTRNLGKQTAHLLLFAVDSERVVHWIAPEYAVAGTDPSAVTIPPSQAEALSATAVVFDDLALGGLRVVALITQTAEHVSKVEALDPKELTTERLAKHFPHAELRQIALTVTR